MRPRQANCLSAITLYIRECMALIPSELKDSNGQSKSLTALSHNVLLKTSTPWSLDAKITLRDYLSSLMGESLLGGCGTYAHRTGLERYLNARCQCIRRF